MNYLEHFGLQSEPFQNVPSARVFYKSAAHGKALLKLMTMADAGGGVVRLLGEAGVGKTLVLRRVIDALSEETHRIAVLPGAAGAFDEARAAALIGLQMRAGSAFGSLEEVAAHCTDVAGNGLTPVILVDDADRVSKPLVDRLVRMEDALVVLTGGRTFGSGYGEKLLLSPLGADGTEAYIKLRLRLAGRAQEVFNADAIAAVHEATGGFPARINLLCEQALLSAMLAGRERIDDDFVRRVGAGIDWDATPVAASAGALAAVAPLAGAAPAAAVAVAAVEEPGEASEFDSLLGDMAAEEQESEAPAVSAASPGAPEENALGADFGALEDEAGDSADATASADGDLDDMLGSLEQEEAAAETAASEPGDDLDDMLGALDQEAAVAETAASEPGDDLDDMLGALEQEEAVAETAASEPGDDLDDMLGALEQEEAVAETAASEPGDDLDDMLGALERDDSLAETAAADPADDLDDLLGSLGDDGEASPAAAEDKSELDDLLGALDEDEPADAISASDDDLDSLLGGLADDVDEAPAMSAADPAEDDLGDLLDSLEGDAAAAEATSGDGDSELDDLLSGMVADDEAPNDEDGNSDLDDMLGDLEADLGGAVVVESAAAMPSRAPVATVAAESAGDDLDDLLSGLDEDTAGPVAPAGDDLDDLLSGLDDEPVAAAPVPAKAAAPKGEDDLESLLDSLDEGSAATGGADDLESELDSLLDGLEDL